MEIDTAASPGDTALVVLLDQVLLELRRDLYPLTQQGATVDQPCLRRMFRMVHTVAGVSSLPPAERAEELHHLLATLDAEGLCPTALAMFNQLCQGVSDLQHAGT